MSKTSSEVKNRYMTKAYDQIRLNVRKDSDISRDALDEHVNKTGESLTGFIHRAMREAMQRDTGLEPQQETDNAAPGEEDGGEDGGEGSGEKAG